MGRRFVTAEDIDELAAAGRSRLEVDASTTLTDLARERAHDRGVTIVEVEQAAGSPSGQPSPSARGEEAVAARDRTATPAADAVPRRRLRAAVRAALVAELGAAPEGVDAAIGRVLDRFGLTD
ncbi:MAG: hypothetical protein R6V28_02130 [Nitriliruptoraceae bacterium]